MRVISGLLYTVSLLAIRTSAAEAGIYISDSPSGVSKQALSPATTRLLLARRLGLSKYHSLEGADDAALRILNDFGGKQKALLSTDEPRLDNPRNLVIVEGVKDPEGAVTPCSINIVPIDISAQISFPPLPTNPPSRFQIYRTPTIPVN